MPQPWIIETRGAKPNIEYRFKCNIDPRFCRQVGRWRPSQKDANAEGSAHKLAKHPPR